MRLRMSLVAVVLVLSGCPSRAGDHPPGSRPSGQSPAAHGSTRDAAPPAEVVAPGCRPGRGRVVQQLPDVRVPAVEVPPVRDEAGEEVVAGFTIPAQVVDAGCVIRYDAAGGCLGAVRITGATIPAATVPATVLPEAELPEGGVVPAQEFPAVVAAAETRPGAFSPEVCQATRDGELLTVSRAGAVREGFSRPGVARSGGSRPQRCDGSGCVPGVVVPTVRLPPVRLPDVDVDPARLESRTLPGLPGIDVLRGEGRTSYVAPGEVLFATDSARLRPEAQAALRAIAGRIESTAPDAELLIEGLTDDRASRGYNLGLSRRRAAAVADWFVEAGFDGSRIRTRGLGEADPAYPNTTAANRAKNRRVVISVLS